MPALSTIAFGQARGAVSGFWRWWMSELAQLVPAARVPRLGRGKLFTDIRPYRDRIEMIRSTNNAAERLVEHTPIDDLDGENWSELAELMRGYDARILLAPPLVHVLTLNLPKPARARLKTAIPLQLRDVAPVNPDLLTWRIVDVAPRADRIDVRVVIVRDGLITRITDSLAAYDERVPPIFAEIGDGAILLRPRRGAGIAPGAPWISAAAVLASTPLWVFLTLTLLVGLKRSDVTELEQQVAPKMAIERSLRDHYETARALKDILNRPTISDLIGDLAGHLPESASVHELSMSPDGNIAMTVEAADPDALRQALGTAPRLAGLRNTDQSATSNGTFLIHYQGKLR